jgi:iron complex outermembrane receptor protein
LNTSPKQTQVPGYQSNFEFDSSNVTLFGSHKVDDIEMSVDLNTRNKKTAWLYNYNASTVSPFYQTPYETAWGKTNNETNTNSFSPRIKVSNFLKKDNSLTIGLDWSRSELSMLGLKSSGSSSTYTSTKTSSDKSEGIYFYDDLKLSSTDRLIFGGRRHRYNQGSTSIYDELPILDPAYIDDYRVKKYLNAYEIQYSKKLSYGFEPYIKKGNSFRLPTADDNSLSFSGPLRPQISQDQELGVKWNNSISSMRVSLFQSNLTDEIVFSGGENKNEIPTVKKGVDTNFTHKLSSTFTLRANLQIINAEISQGANAGKKTPGVAQRVGGLGLETKLNNNHTVDIMARGATGKFASEDTANAQGKSSGYIVGDLSYIIKDKTWTWVARVNNILDKQYSDYSIYKSFGYNDPFKMTLYPNPGRNFSLTGRYVF